MIEVYNLAGKQARPPRWRQRVSGLRPGQKVGPPVGFWRGIASAVTIDYSCDNTLYLRQYIVFSYLYKWNRTCRHHHVSVTWHAGVTVLLSLSSIVSRFSLYNGNSLSLQLPWPSGSYDSASCIIALSKYTELNLDILIMLTYCCYCITVVYWL